MNYGWTLRDGTGRVTPHRKPRDKSANHAFAGSIPRDRTYRKEPKWDDQFVALAESFGFTPDEFMRKLRMERQLRKLVS